MRLRALYIDQLYRLKHVLREKRRNYLHSLRSERETLCSIHDQAKDTISERKMYQKLKALNKYQKRNGVEAILYKKFLEKRQKVCTNESLAMIGFPSIEHFLFYVFAESRWNTTNTIKAIIPYALCIH